MTDEWPVVLAHTLAFGLNNCRWSWVVCQCRLKLLAQLGDTLMYGQYMASTAGPYICFWNTTLPLDPGDILMQDHKTDSVKSLHNRVSKALIQYKKSSCTLSKQAAGWASKKYTSNFYHLSSSSLLLGHLPALPSALPYQLHLSQTPHTSLAPSCYKMISGP